MRPAVAFVIAVALTGCGNLGYYTQSVSGHLDLMSKREPIADVLARPETPADLKAKLEFALRVREFASSELKLPDNGSFRGYADVQREHVVWNVFAAPEFSTDLREWCFLFAGCVRYRGYYAHPDAQSLGEQLRVQGDDVYVGGVDVYSTLGWFDDPVLNTFVRRSYPALAGVIFHELAHQQLYIQNDTAFNESFAHTVEVEGVRRWFEREGNAEGYATFLRNQARQHQFVDLVLAARAELQAIYAGGAADADKRAAKTRVFDAMRARYAALKQEWGGYDGYDAWFAQHLNNAKLGSVLAYVDYVPAFTALLRTHDGDFERFYRAVQEIGALPENERKLRLDALAQR